MFKLILQKLKKQLIVKQKRKLLKKPKQLLLRILQENNIILKNDKVYRIIIKIKNSIYPKDDNFLSTINNIT